VLTQKRGGLALATVLLASACAVNPPQTPLPSVSPLDLQVRNSGLRAGFLWLAGADEPDRGRWHAFGMATFSCVTCPTTFTGSSSGYAITVFDDACRQMASARTLGGGLIVEIDPGPVVRIGAAPPLGDWLPEDLPPVDPSSVPCARPLGRSDGGNASTAPRFG
jgi:hypothetical protein